MLTLFPPAESATIEDLGEALGLEGRALAATVREFNAACRGGDFDPAARDGCRTEGLSPEKTNWARPLDQPPFYGWPMRPGITFTYRGVRVDRAARVQTEAGRPAPNLWAAGEVMAGNILGQSYLAGIGITIGAVFGRRAGEDAARVLRN